MKRWLRYLAPLDWFTPGFLLKRALLIAAIYLVATLAGLDRYTTFISGTVEGESMNSSALIGVFYMMAYFAFVLLAPIMAIAAGILALAGRWRQQRQ